MIFRNINSSTSRKTVLAAGCDRRLRFLSRDDEKKLSLTVEPVRAEKDVGRSVARISEEAMEKLGVKQGDILEIGGSDNTGAIVRTGYEEDKGEDIIRIDGLLRESASAFIGEKVTVSEANVKEAVEVTLTPTLNIRLRGRTLKKSLLESLLGRPMSRDDILVPTGLSKKQMESLEEDMDKLSKEETESLKEKLEDIDSLRFIVTDKSPSGIVLVTNNTEINISSLEVTKEKIIHLLVNEQYDEAISKIEKLK